MAAPLFSVSAHRHDPYRTFKFQILLDGQVVAAMRKMGAFRKSTGPPVWRGPSNMNAVGIRTFPLSRQRWQRDTGVSESTGY